METEMISEEKYSLNEIGIIGPPQSIEHRDKDSDAAWFEVLRDMQSRHFWYLGRHRFILHSLKRFLFRGKSMRRPDLQAIDLGGGCGGWIRYLQAQSPALFAELALADSSTH